MVAHDETRLVGRAHRGLGGVPGRVFYVAHVEALIPCC